MDFETARGEMVKAQIAARGVTDEQVLTAMNEVPRHEFVPEDARPYAYQDSPQPIGHGQTISQPYIVAFMTEKLAPRKTDRVLEIGTGSGYQAAVLSSLVQDVYSIEIIDELADKAARTLARLGYQNVHVRSGDGFRGWPEHAPFDAVIVTCAPDEIPEPLIDQLKDGGRMVIPVGDATSQTLYVFEKRSGKLEQKEVLPVRFVPMTGEGDSR